MNSQLKRRVFLASIPLLLAIALIGYRVVLHQMHNRAETAQTSPSAVVVFDIRDRMNRKVAELDRRGIKGQERQRELNQELQVAFQEWRRVAATNYRSPYNMNSR
jgi:hypothetical protein